MTQEQQHPPASKGFLSLIDFKEWMNSAVRGKIKGRYPELYNLYIKDYFDDMMENVEFHIQDFHEALERGDNIVYLDQEPEEVVED